MKGSGGVFWDGLLVEFFGRFGDVCQAPSYPKETIGDCAEQRERPEVRALTVWRLKHTVRSTVQAAKEWQRQLRLPTTPSGGTCMTACTLHKSQKESSSLSRLTKKVT